MADPVTLDEVWRLFKDTDAKLDRLTREVDRVNRKSEDLVDKWSRFVESMVAPACERLFLQRGIPVHIVSQRVRVRRNGGTMEVDVVVENDAHVVLVEVKSTLRVEDVRDHLARLAEAKSYFPRFAGKQVLGAVAGMTIVEDADRFAYREGLFVLAPAGDTVRLLNDERFAPRMW